MPIFFKNTLLSFIVCCNLLQASEFFHADDNPEAAAIALETFQRINTEGNWRYPKMQADGTREPYSVNSEHWSVKFRSRPGGGTAPYLANNKCISDGTNSLSLREALEDLLSKPAIIDCTMTQAVVIAMCTTNILNQLFSSLEIDGKTAVLRLGESENEMSILLPSIKKRTLFSNGKPALGSFGHAPSIPEYHTIHPNGLSGGLSIICVGRNDQGLSLFLGFDPGQELFEQPRTFIEVLQYLHQETLKPVSPNILSFLQESLQDKYKRNFQLFHKESIRKTPPLFLALS